MLSTERITLRPLEPQDLEFLYRWENDTTLWQYADTVAPLSQHLLRNYIDNYDADIFRASQLRLMIEHRHRDIVDKHGYPRQGQDSGLYPLIQSHRNKRRVAATKAEKG